MTSAPQYNISIHIGANTFSLLISELKNNTWSEVEYLEQPIPLARDVFRHNRVKRDTIERCSEILENYLTIISEYGLTIESVTEAAVTNIVEESKNHHIFLNRLEVASGIKFTPLDNGGMTRLIFSKVQRHQSDTNFTTEGNTLAIHVGPGNTRVLLLNDGFVIRYTTYRLGTHRSAETLVTTERTGREYLNVIKSQCKAAIASIQYDYRKTHINNIILIGHEVQLTSNELCYNTFASPSIEKYEQFVKSCAELNEEERLRNYNLDYHSEDAFLPALQINLCILKAFDIERYWIPSTNFERGLLRDLHITHGHSNLFRKETLMAARLIARKYEADSNHYEHVLKFATQLFQQTQSIHNLDERALFYLQIATIIHEVGGYISPRMHHKHSYYLINNSEIFGLNQETIQIIALIARYHRQSPPKTTHKEFNILSRSDQLLVSKLASILRVADAIDAAQQQRIKTLTISLNNDRLDLIVEGAIDLDIEKLSLANKGRFFETLFGLELHLSPSPAL